MAKTRLEKIEGITEQIEQLKNAQKLLIQKEKAQERKDRTRRLCKRAGLLESLSPDTIPLTDEQFKSFLEKTIITEHSRRILDGLTAQNTVSAAPKPIVTAQSNAMDKSEDEGNGARVTG